MRNKLKKIVTVVGVMCMLLSVVNVSSNAEMTLCGDTVIEEIRQS